MQDQRQESKDKRQDDIAGPPLMSVSVKTCILAVLRGRLIQAQLGVHHHFVLIVSVSMATDACLFTYNVKPLLLATPGSTVQFGDLEVFDMR